MDGPAWRLTPTWKANLLIFGILILIVVLYFFWQIHAAEKTFIVHVQEHTRMIATLIRLNAANAMAARDVTEEIMATFLGHTARFVDYLDAVEPFSESELSAFAAETGLTGITVVSRSGSITQGPAGWLSIADPICASDNHILHHNPAAGLYYLILPGAETQCIAVGLTDARIEALQQQISLPELLNTLTGLSNIRYVRIEKDPAQTAPFSRPDIALLGHHANRLAEARLSMGPDMLVVGMEAGFYFVRIQHLKHELAVFSVLIALLGLFFSWLLYRYHNAWLEQMRQFERRLAKEQEDATLGRATATIAHEIRNPLNAISMGLQRLQIEARDLADDHRSLIGVILQAVHRTNGIITDLRRFVGPVTPKRQIVDVGVLIADVLALYHRECLARGITAHCDASHGPLIRADHDLLEVVIGNLIKNAIEAQPQGGIIQISSQQKGDGVAISFENGETRLPSENISHILQPWFTTKTQGSGLGLAIVNRIIQAHCGRIEVMIPKPGWIRIVIWMPCE